MRLPALLLAVLAAGGCGLLEFYREETAGISPAQLLPLALQEKQYVTDRNLEAKVRGALAARAMHDVEVDVYLEDVTLRGDPRAAEVVKRLSGVKSVRHD